VNRCSGDHDFKLDDLTIPGVEMLKCERCPAAILFDLAHREWVRDGSHGTVHDKAQELWRHEEWARKIEGQP
jgi:hypothetical protein